MATNKSLTKEILLNIFGRLDSLDTISKCRLVCKAWDDPAETAMFTRPLEIHKNNATKLIRHLKNKPEKGHLVRILKLSGISSKDIIKKALLSAFTPKIEVLQGPEDDHLFQTITEIAEKSPIKFERLKSIPDTYSLNNNYSRASLTFKESLEHLHLNLEKSTDSQKLIHRLDEFKSLNSLSLEGSFKNITELEAILQGCCHLQKLNLCIEQFHELDSGLDKRVNWATKDVKKVNTVKNLEIVSVGFPTFIEYLMFKYPNVENFSLNTLDLDDSVDSDYYESLNINRIVDAIKHMKRYSLDYKIPPRDNLSSVFHAAMGDFNILALGYHEYDGTSDISMHLETNLLEDGTRQTKFTMKIPSIATDYYHVKVITETEIPFDRLEIDFLNYKITDADIVPLAKQLTIAEEAVIFFDSLYDFPEIKEIKLTSHYINEASDMFCRTPDILLRSLEICSAEISKDAFECLDMICRHLKELRLMNCQMDLDRQNTIHIRMPGTSFDKFVFQSVPVRYLAPDNFNRDNDEANEYFEKVLKDVEQTYSAGLYLCLGIKESRKSLYYKITPSVDASASMDIAKWIDSGLLISKDEFESRSNGIPVIHLSCHCIKTLVISVGTAFVYLDEKIIDASLNSALSAILDDDDEEED